MLYEPLIRTFTLCIREYEFNRRNAYTSTLSWIRPNRSEAHCVETRLKIYVWMVLCAYTTHTHTRNKLMIWWTWAGLKRKLERQRKGRAKWLKRYDTTTDKGRYQMITVRWWCWRPSHGSMTYANDLLDASCKCWSALKLMHFYWRSIFAVWNRPWLWWLRDDALHVFTISKSSEQARLFGTNELTFSVCIRTVRFYSLASHQNRHHLIWHKWIKYV